MTHVGFIVASQAPSRPTTPTDALGTRFIFLQHRSVEKRMIISIALVLSLSISAAGRSKEPTTGPTVVLPTFVVIGTRIPSSWLEVAYECKGATPITPIKKAWISKVGRGTPAEAAGLHTGDILLWFDNQEIATMTGYGLQNSLQRERDVGTRLEMVVQTAGTARRTVAIVFK